jgi:Ca2+/Na+ antiporter
VITWACTQCGKVKAIASPLAALSENCPHCATNLAVHGGSAVAQEDLASAVRRATDQEFPRHSTVGQYVLPFAGAVVCPAILLAVAVYGDAEGLALAGAIGRGFLLALLAMVLVCFDPNFLFRSSSRYDRITYIALAALAGFAAGFFSAYTMKPLPWDLPAGIACSVLVGWKLGSWL